tara:strand:+ start:313 stop:852 length:540 start_codon:yes stop_codon:yes gene_type:complete
MGERFNEISDRHKAFIEEQKIFFVATATADSRVNLSPKGIDSLRVLDANRVIWLSVTGSGNETSAHIQENARMTVMFTSFTKKPLILRLYGQAREIKPTDSEWDELGKHFPEIPGARQIFDVSVDLVQASCGMSVPFYEFQSERETLSDWASKIGKEGVAKYWKDKNQFSIDGKPTNII